MLLCRALILRNLNHSPNPHRTSHTTLPLSALSPSHRNTSTSRENARPKTYSPVHVGTSYEHLCARTLPRLEFQHLTRTGGAGDRGIDLLGQWLPQSLQRTDSPPLNVVVQCKARAQKAGPEVIRELEGALASAPGEWRGQDTIGVLCAKREATPGVRDALRRSMRGVVWVMIEDLDEGKSHEDKEGDGDEMTDRDARNGKGSEERKDGRIKQILWNNRVQKLVGEGTGTGVVHMPGEAGGRMETEILLSNNGILAVPDHGGQRMKDDLAESSHA